MISGWPLVVKELARIASRPRVYWIRALFALALLISFASVYDPGRDSGTIGGLGTGAHALRGQVSLAYGLLFFLLPGLMAGTLSEERERRTWDLLAVTPLGPWGILLAKYASRLIPVLGLLALTFPLLAMAHAAGGFELRELWLAECFLLLAVLQVGAIGLFASAVSSRTTTSLALSYVLTGLVYVGVPMLKGWALGQDWALEVRAVLPDISLAGSGGLATSQVALRGAASLLITVLFLGLTRVRLARPACRPPLVPWSDVQAALKRAAPSPSFLSLGGFLLLLVVLLLAIDGMSRDDAATLLGLLVFLCWGLALVLLAARAASLFPAERLALTLDLLLVTPLPGAEIVRHKLREMHRTLAWLVVPFLALILLKAMVLESLLYFLGSLACLALYLPLIVWFSVGVGFLARDRSRAVAGAIGGLLAWTFVPVMVFLPFLASGEEGSWALFFLSPVVVPALLEAGIGRSPVLPFGFVLLNSVWYGACWATYRRWVLQGADRWLERA